LGCGCARVESISAKDHIEVEQKFPMLQPGELESRLLALGGILKGRAIFTDTYWDVPGHGITLKNIWLRQRSGLWELKVGPSTWFPGDERKASVNSATHRFLPWKGKSPTRTPSPVTGS
jgi:hypothetical protein